MDPPPSEMFVRVERETLRRFPMTNCVLFTIRTYVAPLACVLDEAGAAGPLAAALDAMPTDIGGYKDLTGRIDDVARYLRSST